MPSVGSYAAPFKLVGACHANTCPSIVLSSWVCNNHTHAVAATTHTHTRKDAVTDTNKQTNADTNKQTNKRANEQTSKQANKQRHRHRQKAHTHKDRKTERQKDRKTERHQDTRRKDTHTHTQRHTHTHTHAFDNYNHLDLNAAISPENSHCKPKGDLRSQMENP